MYEFPVIYVCGVQNRQEYDNSELDQWCFRGHILPQGKGVLG